MISIKGLDKALVLLSLWNRSHEQGMSFFGKFTSSPTVDDARKFLIEHDYYADYFNGRVIKVDFRGDEINPGLYDRDCGTGACAEAVEAVRMRTVDSSTIKISKKKEWVVHGTSDFARHVRSLMEDCKSWGPGQEENELFNNEEMVWFNVKDIEVKDLEAAVAEHECVIEHNFKDIASVSHTVYSVPERKYYRDRNGDGNVEEFSF